MARHLISNLAVVVVLLLVFASRAQADDASDRALIGDALVKLSATAESLAKTAKASDDRAVRKKFAPAAIDLADDLGALANRARKEVPIATVTKELAAIDRAAVALVELADEAEEKDERKALRAQATQLQQTIASSRRIIEAYAAKKDDAKKDDAKKDDAKPGAMAAAAFDQLVGAVRGASFNDDKVGVIKHAAATNWFTSQQVATLIALISFDDDRIEGAVACWSRLVDPQNSFVILKVLSFDDSREKLRKRVAK
jgi:hypothetical protein